MRPHRATLGIVVLTAIAGLVPSAASAATSCGFASGVMTVEMSAVHDDASFSVASNGEIVVRQIMRVTMSYDHRVIDGATGAKFLQTFKKILENPLYLVV